MGDRMRPTNLASEIARGLIRTGRATRSERIGDLLKLDRVNGGSYWLDFLGAELKQGPTLLDAEPLQDSFRLAMALAGRGPRPAVPETRSEPTPMFHRSGRDVVFER